MVSATHSTSQTWAEPVGGHSQLQSQTQSLTHTLCFAPVYKEFLNRDDMNLCDIITLCFLNKWLLFQTSSYSSLSS